MKHLATVAVLAALLAIGVWIYRGRHTPTGPAIVPLTNDEPELAIVLPARSEEWSNLTRTSALPASPLVRRTSSVLTSPSVPVEASLSRTLDSQAVRARARELLAQAGLESVGIDAEANQNWLLAITDSNLSAEQRRDLILALNQAGLINPAEPGADDLPLIAARIALLEEASAQAVDDAVANAFQEVYTDLQTMYASASASLSTAATPPANDVESAR